MELPTQSCLIVCHSHKGKITIASLNSLLPYRNIAIAFDQNSFSLSAHLLLNLIFSYINSITT